MEDRDVLLQEYNNLWNEKLVHKQSIRKFHNYLSYITAIGSLALTFHGVSTSDFFKMVVDKDTANNLINNMTNIVNLLFIPFAPVVLITITFPINDMFHIYAMGKHIGEIERKINILSNNKILLAWEHHVCPVVYGGEKVNNCKEKVTNLIFKGDTLLLFPSLIFICIFTTALSIIYICDKGHPYLAVLYFETFLYMLTVILYLGLRLRDYTNPNGILNKLIQSKNADTKVEYISIN